MALCGNVGCQAESCNFIRQGRCAIAVLLAKNAELSCVFRRFPGTGYARKTAHETPCPRSFVTSSSWSALFVAPPSPPVLLSRQLLATALREEQNLIMLSGSPRNLPGKRVPSGRGIHTHFFQASFAENLGQAATKPPSLERRSYAAKRDARGWLKSSYLRKALKIIALRVTLADGEEDTTRAVHLRWRGLCPRS